MEPIKQVRLETKLHTQLLKMAKKQKTTLTQLVNEIITAAVKK